MSSSTINLPANSPLHAPPSNVGVVVGCTVLGLAILSCIVGFAFWHFGPKPQLHSFAALHTADDIIQLSHGTHRYQSRSKSRISVQIGVEIASTPLHHDHGEKLGLNRRWSAERFYQRWPKKNAGALSDWWNPMEKIERQTAELEKASSSSPEGFTPQPSRDQRLATLQSSGGGNWLSNVQGSSSERVSLNARRSMVLPPLHDDAQAFAFDNDYGPQFLSPIVLNGPIIPLQPLIIEPSRSNSRGNNSRPPSPSPTSLTPFWSSYIDLIQRSLSLGSSESHSVSTATPAINDPSSSSLPDAPPHFIRTVSSSTFGPNRLPRLDTSPPTFFDHPSPQSSHSLSSPLSNFTAVSVSSSFARYVSAIQRSLSGSTTNTSTAPSRASTRKTNVSRAPTSRTFGSRRGEREGDEEEQRLVGPAFPSGGWRGGDQAEEEDVVTMESYRRGSFEEADIVEVVGRGRG